MSQRNPAGNMDGQRGDVPEKESGKPHVVVAGIASEHLEQEYFVHAVLDTGTRVRKQDVMVCGKEIET